MHAFKDGQNRTWVVEIHHAAIKRVEAETGVKLVALLGDGLAPLNDLLADLVRLVDVLYVLCREQADRAGLSDEQFGRGLVGDGLDRAAQAFVKELIDFFPQEKVRARLRRVMDRAEQVRDAVLDRMGSRLEEMDPAAVATSLLPPSSGGSGSAPGASASTPDPTPSGS